MGFLYKKWRVGPSRYSTTRLRVVEKPRDVSYYFRVYYTVIHINVPVYILS